jgi:hypothetical protein
MQYDKEEGIHMEKNNYWTSLEKALTGNNKGEFESVRDSVVSEKGYDYFRKLQNDIFWSWADKESNVKK